MTEHMDRAYHAVAMFVVLNITGSLSDYLPPPPASNNNAGAKCTVFCLVVSEMWGCMIPSGSWHTLSQKQLLVFLCMHDEGTEKSSEDLTTCHADHQKHFFPPLLFLFALFN